MKILVADESAGMRRVVMGPSDGIGDAQAAVERQRVVDGPSLGSDAERTPTRRSPTAKT